MLKFSFLLGGLLLFQINLYSQGIFGGVPADISEAPFTVSVEKNGEHHCGGSILNCEWIVTAAHCVSGAENTPQVFTIHAGATDQTDNSIGQRIVADQVIIHPQYQPCGSESSPPKNDIALIHLSKKLFFTDNIQPIQYAPAGTTPSIGSIVSIYGWGEDAVGSGSQAILQKAALPVISNDDAGQLLIGAAQCVFSFYSPLIDNSYLALYKEGFAAGSGDSGGPAVYNNSLVGASAFGSEPDTDKSLYPTVYSDISVLSGFIESHINQEELAGCCSEEGLEIWTAQLWADENRSFKGNVTIKPGGSLNIENSNIAFEEDYGIIVEAGGQLVTENSTLTRCALDPNWAGVKVQSSSNGNPAGTVTMTGGRVEYAKTGISTNRGGSPWNGLIQCDGTTFEYNRRAVEFMQNKAPNQSRFDNCFFLGDPTNNIDYGVTIWDAHDIHFTNCEFSNFAHSGIYTVDASFRVLNECSFTSCSSGIYATSTSGIADNQTEIRDAIFSDNFYGIYSGSMADFDVYTSNFSCNAFGAVAIGTSNFFYYDNDFNNHVYSIALSSTAGQDNLLWCNDYSNAGVGVNIFGDNSSLLFDYEGYNTQTNIQLDGRPSNKGSVQNIQQRDGGGPLSNTFSATTAEIASDLNNGHTASFFYRHPDEDLYPDYFAECDEAPSANLGCSIQNNYKNYTFKGAPVPCPPLRPDPITNCDDPDCLGNIRSNLNNIRSNIENGNGSDELQNDLDIFTAKKEVATYNFINNYLEIGDYETMETVLTNESADNSDLMKLIEVQIFTEQYDLAQTHLSDFQPSNLEESNFIVYRVFTLTF